LSLFLWSYRLVGWNLISARLANGTQMGWLIDPAEWLVVIYQPQQQPIAIDSPETILLVPNFASAVQLALGQIFDWLKVALQWVRFAFT